MAKFSPNAMGRWCNLSSGSKSETGNFRKALTLECVLRSALQSVTCINMQFELAIETRLVEVLQKYILTQLNKKITIEMMVF